MITCTGECGTVGALIHCLWKLAGAYIEPSPLPDSVPYAGGTVNATKEEMETPNQFQLL